MKTKKIQKTVLFQKGKLVSLEPFSFERCEEFYQLYLTSKTKWEKFIVLHFDNINDAKRYIAQQFSNDRFTGYFVINNSTNKMVGFIFGDESGDGTAILRTRATGCEYENMGYGFEATQLFESLMRKAGYSSIKLACDTDNQRSKKLLLRDGYVYNETVHIPYWGGSLDLEFYSKQL